MIHVYTTNQSIYQSILQAKQLTTKNLQSTLFELEQVTAVASTQPRSYLQIGFLSQLLADFLNLAASSSSAEAEVDSIDARFDALEFVLKLVAHQSDFVSVICTSLHSALSQHSNQQHSTIDDDDNDLLVLSLLKLLLTTRSKKPIAHNNKATSTTAKSTHYGLDKLSASTFAISLYSGWNLFQKLSSSVSNESDKDQSKSISKSYQFLQRYLELLLELDQLVEVTPAVKQVVLCTFSSKVRKDPFYSFMLACFLRT